MSLSHNGNSFWDITPQTAQVVPHHFLHIPDDCNFTSQKQLNRKAGKRSISQYFTLTYTVLCVKPWREVKRVLNEEDAVDYNFSCTTMSHRVRGSRSTIRSHLHKAVPYHMNARQTVELNWEYFMPKTRGWWHIYQVYRNKKLSQGHIPITGKDLSSTKTEICVDKTNKAP